MKFRLSTIVLLACLALVLNAPSFGWVVPLVVTAAISLLAIWCEDKNEEHDFVMLSAFLCVICTWAIFLAVLYFTTPRTSAHLPLCTTAATAAGDDTTTLDARSVVRARRAEYFPHALTYRVGLNQSAGSLAKGAGSFGFFPRASNTGVVFRPTLPADCAISKR